MQESVGKIMKINHKCTFHFDEEKGILFKNYTGRVTLDNVINTWKNAIEKDKVSHDTKGIVVNFLKAKIDMEPVAAEEIVAFYRSNMEIFGGKKIAILTGTPRDIIIPVLMHEQSRGFEVRPFSTLDAACDWISE